MNSSPTAQRKQRDEDGHSGSGSIWHLAHSGEAKAGVKYTALPFGGAAPAVVALLGDHIDAVAGQPGQKFAAQVQANKLRMLAVAPTSACAGSIELPTSGAARHRHPLATWRASPQRARRRDYRHAG